PLGEAGVIAIFAYRLLRGEGCVINGDGAQTRDYVFVGDVAEAIARGLERPETQGVINIGTGLETSVNELYERLARAIGPDRPACRKAYPIRDGSPVMLIDEAQPWTPGS